MLDPTGFDRRLRVAMLIALVIVVVVAPLVGVYTFSPFFFAWGLDPYLLAAAVGVMLAEAIAIAILSLLVFRSRR